MPEDLPNTSDSELAAPQLAHAESPHPPVGAESPENAKDHDPMLDIHPPHHAATTWRDFFIHIATIVLGLIIAICLEQSVEFLHHRHQRQQLQEDLHNEAEQNLQIIDRDLKMQDLEPWFEQAMHAATAPKKKRNLGDAASGAVSPRLGRYR